MFVQLQSRRKPRPPWATVLLVATCVALFLWLVAEPLAGRGVLLSYWGTVPAT